MHKFELEQDPIQAGRWIVRLYHGKELVYFSEHPNGDEAIAAIREAAAKLAR